MPQSIVQIQDYQGNLHDLDNRYITLSAASGTLSTDDLSVLQASSKNYIIYSDKIYKLTLSNSSVLQYSREDAINNTHETITVTVSSGTFEYSVIDAGSSYQGFSPWSVDPRHCARVVIISTGENSGKCSVRRSITDTEGEYYPLNDYTDFLPQYKLPPYMRFLDSEFCTFTVERVTDPETGDTTTVVSELNFTISNPNETLVALANAARGFFITPNPDDYNFQVFLQNVFAISGHPTSDNLEQCPVSFWVFA